MLKRRGKKKVESPVDTKGAQFLRTEDRFKDGGVLKGRRSLSHRRSRGRRGKAEDLPCNLRGTGFEVATKLGRDLIRVANAGKGGPDVYFLQHQVKRQAELYVV